MIFIKPYGLTCQVYMNGILTVYMERVFMNDCTSNKDGKIQEQCV